MRKVAIVGAGQSKYGEFPEKGIKELFLDAYKDMTASVDKGFDPKSIDSAYIGNLGSGGFQLGNMSALVAEYCGLPYIHTVRVENACGSGGYALVAAVMDVMSGNSKLSIAGGVEKMTDVSGTKQKYWLGVSGDTEYERLAGTTFLRPLRADSPQAHACLRDEARAPFDGGSEEPQERGSEPEGSVPEGDHAGAGHEGSNRGISPEPLRLLLDD